MPHQDPIHRLLRADLNLLPVLLVLIETESAKVTAERIGRTQSAVSHALNRLRDLFGDELFVRHGPRLAPTPLIASLREPLRHVLLETSRVIDQAAAFDPATSDRRVVIGAPDVALPLAQEIIARIRTAAPKGQLRLTNHRQGNARLANGEIDLLISLYRHKAEPGQTMARVGVARWCVFAPEELDLPVEPTFAHWQALPHVQVHTGPGGRSPVEDAAAVVGATRRVALQVSTFLEALHIARKSQLLFTSFQELVGPLAEALGLRAYPPPFAIPSAPVAILTREIQRDPFSRWLAALGVEAAQAFFEARRNHQPPILST